MNIQPFRIVRTMLIDLIRKEEKKNTHHIALNNDPTRSQITKWVAYGLKSGVCLFEGTYKYPYPIPLTDLQLKPALGQNPGWN